MKGLWAARVAAGQDALGQLAGRDLLAQQEGVEVGDHDLGAVEPFHQLGRHHVELAVVVVGVVGQQHAQAVADGDARRDDEERVAEAGVLRVVDLVERVPGDEHRHDHRLAAAGGHLEGHAVELGVGGLVGLAQLVGQVLLAGLADALGEVDRRLGRLDLAEEEAAVTVAAAASTRAGGASCA